MKAVRIYVDLDNTDLVGSVVEELNMEAELVATMVGAKELFVAAVGECAIKYAIARVGYAFSGELSVQYVK